MLTNRIEWLSGRRWAQDVVLSSASLLSTTEGPQRLMASLRLGLASKPPSYAAGVQEIITITEDALMVRALEKTA